MMRNRVEKSSHKTLRLKKSSPVKFGSAQSKSEMEELLLEEIIKIQTTKKQIQEQIADLSAFEYSGGLGLKYKALLSQIDFWDSEERRIVQSFQELEGLRETKQLRLPVP